MFYIGSCGFVCRIIVPVTFAHCAFIFALRNIALGRYLDTRRNIKNIYGTTYGLKYIYISKIRAIERTRKLALLTIKVLKNYGKPNVAFTWHANLLQV